MHIGGVHSLFSASHPRRNTTCTATSIHTCANTHPSCPPRTIRPQDNLSDIEHGFLSFVTPIVNFIQDTSYKAFSIADATVSEGGHVFLEGQQVKKSFGNNWEHKGRTSAQPGSTGRLPSPTPQ